MCLCTALRTIAMQAPPLRAVVPPLRESRWAPEWQRKILQRELLPLAFYRRLVGCDETEQARTQTGHGYGTLAQTQSLALNLTQSLAHSLALALPTLAAPARPARDGVRRARGRRLERDGGAGLRADEHPQP